MLEKVSHFYQSNKTFMFAIIATMILEPLGMIMGLMVNDLIPFEIIAYAVLFLLLIGLFITHHKKDYILMNGIISGILMYMFVRYAYLLSFFADEETLLYCHEVGPLACLGISLVYIIIAVVFLITYNHFTINRSRKVNRTKIVLNQFLLFLSFFVPFIYTALSPLLIFDEIYTTYQMVGYIIIYFSDAFLLLTVACCEFELAMNRNDKTTLEDLNLADIKMTLWYASSFIFSLFCICLSILSSSSNVISFVFSIFDALLSLSLLIYYLNKKKEASGKLKTCLSVFFAITIGIMIFFVGRFIWLLLI